jgi:hypothetical protein
MAVSGHWLKQAQACIGKWNQTCMVGCVAADICKPSLPKDSGVEPAECFD